MKKTNARGKRYREMMKILIVACIAFVALAGIGIASGCCQCMKSCGDDFSDQHSCMNYCLGNNDSYVNFYDGDKCSEYPACTMGACCDQEPECTQTTRLYCNAYWGGFLEGKSCADCPQPTISLPPTEEPDEYMDIFMKEYDNIVKIPLISNIFGNERINLYVDGEIRGHLITENSTIIDSGKDELQDQTMNVYISKETLEEIREEKTTFAEALKEGKIRYEGVGFINSLKFMILGFLSKIFL